MVDKIRSDRSVEVGLSSRSVWRMLTRRRRMYILLLELFLIALVALVGHITGRELGRRNLVEREETIQQLRSERQELSGELSKRTERLNAVQAKLNEVQTALDAIVPSENTYNISPNQSLVLGGGRMTVGLVGAPSNQGVTININGKQHIAAAGDVIAVTVDPTTTCQVSVQSFDMFKAVLNATCPAKPQ